jgi:hypothetical protein
MKTLTLTCLLLVTCAAYAQTIVSTTCGSMQQTRFLEDDPLNHNGQTDYCRNESGLVEYFVIFQGGPWTKLRRHRVVVAHNGAWGLMRLASDDDVTGCFGKAVKLGDFLKPPSQIIGPAQCLRIKTGSVWPGQDGWEYMDYEMVGMERQ